MYVLVYRIEGNIKVIQRVNENNKSFINTGCGHYTKRRFRTKLIQKDFIVL